MAGYAGTPLAEKLGIQEGMRLAVIDPPVDYAMLFDALPDVTFVDDDAAPADLVHLFVRDAAALAAHMPGLRERIMPDGMAWVSWPKKASGIRTDVDENVIRAAALAAGLVDVKVCAVDAVWSGLKLVVRRADRVR